MWEKMYGQVERVESTGAKSARNGVSGVVRRVVRRVVGERSVVDLSACEGEKDGSVKGFTGRKKRCVPWLHSQMTFDWSR